MNWTMIRQPAYMQGHKFFRSDKGDIAIADWSGRYPEDTDDGTLWLDGSRPIKLVWGSHSNLLAYIPLINQRGEETLTVSDIRTALFAKQVMNMRVESDNDDMLVLKELLTLD